MPEQPRPVAASRNPMIALLLPWILIAPR